MDVVLARIDDRLIHGQVVVGWVRALDARRLVVVNDTVARNAMQRALMEMCVPSGLAVEFHGVVEGARAVRESHGKGATILLFSNPADVVAFAEAGFPLETVNVGGMHFAEGKRQLSRSLCVDDADLEAFRKLRRLGVEVEVRAVPGDPKVPLEKMLPEIET